MSRRIRLAKEGSWIIAGQVTAVIGSLFLVRVLTEYLDPNTYGQLVLGLTTATLVNKVIMGGIVEGSGRFYSVANERGDISGYLHGVTNLIVYSALAVLFFALLAIISLTSFGNDDWLGLAVAALLFSLFSGFNSTLISIQNAARQRAVVAIHSGLEAWLKILLAVIVIYWLGRSSTAVVVGYTVSSLLVTLSQFYFFKGSLEKKHKSPSKSQSWANSIWCYSWPFSVWGVFTWMQQVADRWSLEYFGTREEVGLYAVVFQLGYTPIITMVGLAMTLIGPILYQRSGDASDDSRNYQVYKLTWRITTVALFIAFVGVILTALFHEWFFKILVAEKYRGVSYLLPWVVLAGGFFAASQMLSLKLMADLSSLSLLTPKIVTALFGVVLNIMGAIIAGLHGVVAALIIYSFIHLFWITFLCRFPKYTNLQVINKGL